MTKNYKGLSLEERQEKDRNYVKNVLMSAQKREWHGTLSVVLKRGEITLVKKEETFLLPKDE